MSAWAELPIQKERPPWAERMRIARELHDVVAHSMAMIYVQATAAGVPPGLTSVIMIRAWGSSVVARDRLS